MADRVSPSPTAPTAQTPTFPPQQKPSILAVLPRVMKDAAVMEGMSPINDTGTV